MDSFHNYLNEKHHISFDLLDKLDKAAADCHPFFREIEMHVDYNQLKVLEAFHANNVSDFHLHGSSGYGYGDSGRDTLEGVYAHFFGTDRALVRAQIVSGTHALAIGLLGILERGDELISATGCPYDTLLKVIGKNGEYGSLIHQGVEYKEIALNNGKINLEELAKNISERTKIIYFQRSGGYEWRPSLFIDDLKAVINTIKQNYPGIICMVDNCYGEFVETKEPTEIGADLIAGSLIKNPGGGLALTGGYLAGKTDLIQKAATRLAAPGIGLGMGASLNFNRHAYQGFFMAPQIVGEALKGATLAARFFEKLGFPVLPRYDNPRTDIIQAIQLGSVDLMVAFCRGLQKASPLEWQVSPEPAELPGYSDPVIMAGGTFIQGSSIELSADGPLRSPYTIYLQGGLSLSHVKVGLALAASEILRAKG